MVSKHHINYEKSEEILRELYKAASFVVQAVCFRLTGQYIRRQTELLEITAPEERAIVETFLKLKGGADMEFDAMSAALLTWAQAKLNE